MKQGMITKSVVTSADISDSRAFIEQKLCPKAGMVFLDKGYDTNAVSETLACNSCANATIQKNNRKTKNRDLDRWRSSVRMPYENIFRNMRKITRYRGKICVEFQVVFESIAHNIKRLIKIHEGGVVIG